MPKQEVTPEEVRLYVLGFVANKGGLDGNEWHYVAHQAFGGCQQIIADILNSSARVKEQMRRRILKGAEMHRGKEFRHVD